MTDESLSKSEIEALLEATDSKEEPLYEKIQKDVFSVLSGDHWMREASLEILEELKKENKKNISRKTAIKLGKSELNLLKEIFTEILIHSDKKSDFLGELSVSLVSRKKILSEFKPGIQSFYGNFSGKIQGIFCWTITNDHAAKVIELFDNKDSQANNLFKYLNLNILSFIEILTSGLSDRIGAIKHSDLYSSLVVRKDHLVLPEGSQYIVIDMTIKNSSNIVIPVKLILSSTLVKDILAQSIEFKPEVKRKLKLQEKIVASIQGKIAKFMSNRDGYLSDEDISGVKEFISKSISIPEKQFLLAPLKDKGQIKASQENLLFNIVFALCNESIDKKYKIFEAEKERKDKILNLISSIPFPLSIRFSEDVISFEMTRTIKVPKLEKFINKTGKLYFAEKFLTDVILKQEFDSYYLFDKRGNKIDKEYEFGLNESELMNLKIDIKAEIGRTVISIENLINLPRQSVIELNRKLNEPIDIIIENIKFAKATVVVNNEKFGIWIEEICDPASSEIQTETKITTNNSMSEVPQTLLSVELGNIKLTLKDLMGISKGSIIQLEKSVFEPVLISLDGVLSFKGQVEILPDDRFGVKFVDSPNIEDPIIRENSVDIDSQFTKEEEKPDIIEYLNSQDVSVLYDSLKDEKPQMVAFIIKYIKPEKAASIIEILEENEKKEVILALTYEPGITMNLAEKILNSLVKKIKLKERVSRTPAGHTAPIEKIFQSLSDESKKKVKELLNKDFS